MKSPLKKSSEKNKDSKTASTRIKSLKEELAKTNRQLEVEAGLERVRTVAMRMRKPDDMLEICRTIAEELKKLNGSEIRNVQTAIFYDEKGSYTNYEFYVKHNKAIVTETEFRNHPVAETFAQQMMKGPNEFFVHGFSGNEVKKWLSYQKTTNVFIDTYLETATSLNYYWYSLGPVALGTSTYKPLTEEEQELFKRFRNVFELAYCRYLDIERAQTQAREAQIEAALERVRSRTMAMYKSSELLQAADILFDQVRQLGAELQGVAFAICNKNSFIVEKWTSIGVFSHPHDIDPGEQRMYEAWKNGIPIYEEVYEGEKQKKYFESFMKIPAFRQGLEKLIELGQPIPAWQKNYAVSFQYGYLLFITTKPFPETNIFLRFGKVFEQTYTRFLDLQKAEAQAREAQIEAALERVRSRTMGMQKSDELRETIQLVYDQMVQLGLFVEHAGFIIDWSDTEYTIWLADKHVLPFKATIPYFDCAHWRSFNEARKNGTTFFTNLHSFEEKNKFYNDLFELLPDVPQETKDYYQACAGLAISTVLLDNVGLYIENFSGIPYTDDENSILMRLGKVFQQTYARFLDLKKAEAQAREAQIEAGLERVRSRAMGMQTSEELNALIGTVFTELTKLDLVLTRCIIWVFETGTNDARWWMANSEEPSSPMSFFIKYHEHPAYLTFVDEWKNQNVKFIYDLKGKDKKNWDKILFNETELKNLPDVVKNGMQAPGRVLLSASFNNFGGINVASLEPLSDEHFNILLRFAKVFDLTYTRFLDLQKAEAQARESQIQLALERVRARTMAMHKSEELAETAQVMFHQLQELGGIPDRISIGIADEKTVSVNFWATDQAGSHINNNFTARLSERTVISKTYQAWKENKRSLVIDLHGNELQEWIRFAREEMGIIVKDENIHDRRVHNLAFFSHGWILVTTHEPQSAETIEILERFASVFSLTYRRFLDLQKAEAQARAAQIEAALERVRAKAMAMHNSNDLASTASMVFTELRKLDIKPIRCGVGLLNKESRKGQLYSATSSANEDNLSLVGWVQLEKHEVLEKIYDTWFQQQDYFPELSGEQLRSYYQLLLAGLSVPIPDFTNDQKQFGHFIPFSIGCLYAWCDVKYNEDQIKTLRRFASIIDLTFRRYIELQQSEANTKEAIKQAALDRIRAEIASMRTVSDLDRITPLIWNELTILNVPFIRCGVFIMDEAQQLIYTFLSTPDGRAIAAFYIPYDTKGNIKQVLVHWKEKNTYISQWTEADFIDISEILVKQGAAVNREQYLDTLPKEGFYLHFLPFLQGMLYVGNTSELNEGEIELLQHVADAFSTAYARYEDFNKLEAAKKQVDMTLNELKATQKQLIQSEKMASLGELTAGIAHEIQNPLNFVNNFAEINSELVDELKNELEKGNIDEVKFLAADLKDNNDKIAFHGKRAESIVKGMLQHSRTSTGKKELADINAIADEFLRLSYHGLRAKDKSFNATMETSFDYNIEKVEIIPQDLGRVLLNLFNNAFYSVNEKKKMLNGLYEPKVFVSTEKLDSKIQIVVKDNGNGIPQKIIDKIYHPFFTTKPTGEGTGLGLSLSYDIITKGHNGELKVETKEGEFASFKIILPV